MCSALHACQQRRAAAGRHGVPTMQLLQGRVSACLRGCCRAVEGAAVAARRDVLTRSRLCTLSRLMHTPNRQSEWRRFASEAQPWRSPAAAAAPKHGPTLLRACQRQSTTVRSCPSLGPTRQVRPTDLASLRQPGSLALARQVRPTVRAARNGQTGMSCRPSSLEQSAKPARLLPAYVLSQEKLLRTTAR